jgi:hypothetical protein
MQSLKTVRTMQKIAEQANRLSEKTANTWFRDQLEDVTRPAIPELEQSLKPE